MALNAGTALSARNVMQNGKTVNTARISLSVLAGGTAGILGLTSFYGLLFYFAASALLGLFYLMQVSRTSGRHVYFANRSQMTTAFVLENLFTYVLVWTLVYGCVHVY